MSTGNADATSNPNDPNATAPQSAPQSAPADSDARAAALADEFLAARQAGAPGGAAAGLTLPNIPPEVYRKIAIEVLKFALARLGA